MTSWFNFPCGQHSATCIMDRDTFTLGFFLKALPKFRVMMVTHHGAINAPPHLKRYTQKNLLVCVHRARQTFLCCQTYRNYNNVHISNGFILHTLLSNRSAYIFRIHHLRRLSRLIHVWVEIYSTKTHFLISKTVGRIKSNFKAPRDAAPRLAHCDQQSVAIQESQDVRCNIIG